MPQLWASLNRRVRCEKASSLAQRFGRTGRGESRPSRALRRRPAASRAKASRPCDCCKIVTVQPNSDRSVQTQRRTAQNRASTRMQSAARATRAGNPSIVNGRVLKNANRIRWPSPRTPGFGAARSASAGARRSASARASRQTAAETCAMPWEKLRLLTPDVRRKCRTQGLSYGLS